MLVHASVQTRIKRPPPKIIMARSYKNFDQAKFSTDIAETPWSVCEVFDDLDDCHWAWTHIFGQICDGHAPLRKIKVRSQSLPWVTPQIRHLMNLRFNTQFFKPNNSKITHDVRVAKCKFSIDLFDEVKDCKSYWKLVKKAAYSSVPQPILGIRSSDGDIETSDHKKAQILDEYFSTLGENLANNLPVCSQESGNIYFYRFTPYITNISISYDNVANNIKKMKTNKASGLDNVSPKLLKHAGKELIPPL